MDASNSAPVEFQQPRKDKPEPPEPSTKASVGSKFTAKIDTPALPADMETAFKQIQADLPVAGNQTMSNELRERHIYGLTFPAKYKCPTPHAVEINPANYQAGVTYTLKGALIRLHSLMKEKSDTELQTRLDHLASTLATGVCLVTFLKTRAIVMTELFDYHVPSILRRPVGTNDLAIPSAFAFAVQQLGVVSIADLHKEQRLAPCFPKEGHKYGINAGTWDPHAYAKAVEYARDLGMHFAVVDLNMKKGTAWWLLRQHFSEDVFELHCPYPEVNFKDSMIQPYVLYLYGDKPDPSNSFIELSTLTDTDHYGVILQDPHVGINFSAFEALSQTAQDILSNV